MWKDSVNLQTTRAPIKPVQLVSWWPLHSLLHNKAEQCSVKYRQHTYTSQSHTHSVFFLSLYPHSSCYYLDCDAQWLQSLQFISTACCWRQVFGKHMDTWMMTKFTFNQVNKHPEWSQWDEVWDPLREIKRVNFYSQSWENPRGTLRDICG